MAIRPFVHCVMEIMKFSLNKRSVHKAGAHLFSCFFPPVVHSVSLFSRAMSVESHILNVSHTFQTASTTKTQTTPADVFPKGSKTRR